MMNKFFTWTLTSMAAFLVFVANSGVGANSWLFHYEPDIPESLKK